MLVAMKTLLVFSLSGIIDLTLAIPLPLQGVPGQDVTAVVSSSQVPSLNLRVRAPCADDHCAHTGKSSSNFTWTSTYHGEHSTVTTTGTSTRHKKTSSATTTWTSVPTANSTWTSASCRKSTHTATATATTGASLGKTCYPSFGSNPIRVKVSRGHATWCIPASKGSLPSQGAKLEILDGSATSFRFEHTGFDDDSYLVK